MRTSVTWERSTIRSWLNGYGSSENDYGWDFGSRSFIDTAFSYSEKAAIKTTRVLNDSAQGYYSTPGGNDTNDKIFLLSYADSFNSAYGFGYSMARMVQPTEYAKANGADVYSGGTGTSAEDNGKGWWWLRSPGWNSVNALQMNYSGLWCDGHVEYSSGCVRPALHISPSSPLLRAAGTVCSDGTEGEKTSVRQPSDASRYLVGTLQAVNTEDYMVTIDGTGYKCDSGYPIVEAGELCKNGDIKVICSVDSNACIYLIEDYSKVIYPHAAITGNQAFKYNNESFNITESRIELCVSLKLKYGYNKNLLSDLTDERSVTSMKVTLDENGPFYLGKEKTWIFGNEEKYYSDDNTDNQTLGFGEPLYFPVTLYMDEDYSVPFAMSRTYPFDASVVVDGREYNVTDKITVLNNDYYRQKRAEEIEQIEAAQAISKARNELKSYSSSITLPVELLYLIDTKQEAVVAKCAAAWIAEVSSAKSFDLSGLEGKLYEEVLSRLGIKKTLFGAYKSEGTFRVKINTAEYGERTIEFRIYGLKFESTEYNLAHMGSIEFEVIDKTGMPPNAITKGSGGVYTGVNMGGFCNYLRDAAMGAIKNAYNESYGKYLDESAELIVDKTILDLMKNTEVKSFSNGLFEIATQPAKKTASTLVRTSCPVDVRVLDAQGNILASISNNAVDESYGDVQAWVEGDDKYFYLIGDDYQIEFCGTDDGTMTYTLVVSDGDSERTIVYEDVPLYAGVEYKANTFDDPYLSESLYAPMTEEGEIIENTSDDIYDTVLERERDIESITFSGDIITVYEGEEFAVGVSVMPADITRLALVWNSSDEDIVSIDYSGHVVANRPGSATITVGAMYSDASDEIEVEVLEKKEEASSSTSGSSSSSSMTSSSSEKPVGSSSSAGNSRSSTVKESSSSSDGKKDRSSSDGKKDSSSSDGKKENSSSMSSKESSSSDLSGGGKHDDLSSSVKDDDSGSCRDMSSSYDKMDDKNEDSDTTLKKISIEMGSATYEAVMPETVQYTGGKINIDDYVCINGAKIGGNITDRIKFAGIRYKNNKNTGNAIIIPVLKAEKGADRLVKDAVKEANRRFKTGSVMTIRIVPRDISKSRINPEEVVFIESRNRWKLRLTVDTGTAKPLKIKSGRDFEVVSYDAAKSTLKIKGIGNNITGTFELPFIRKKVR